MVCTQVIHRLYMIAGSCKGEKPGIRLKGEDKCLAVTRGACHTKLRVETWGENMCRSHIPGVKAWGDNRCRSYRPEGGGMVVTTGADHTDLRVETWGENMCRSHRPEGGGVGVTTGADHTDLRMEAWG